MPKAILLLTILFMSRAGYGASPVQSVLTQLKLLNGTSLSYRYSISLIDMNTGLTLDSNEGRLYRSGTDFVDSNKEFYTAISKRYFCKLDKSRKLASVYVLDVLKQKLGIDPVIPAGEVSVVDSFGFKSPFPQFDSSSAGSIKVTWALATPTPSSFCIYVDRKSYQLQMVQISTVEYVDQQHTYNRICTIRDISNKTPEKAIDFDAVFKLQADKIVMASKYADYTVKSLIN